VDRVVHHHLSDPLTRTGTGDPVHSPCSHPAAPEATKYPMENYPEIRGQQ
jgi:hypothetical protein